MSAGVSTLLSGSSQGQNTRALFRVVILVLIAGAAVASRLFSVIREYTRLASPMKLRHVLSMAYNIERSKKIESSILSIGIKLTIYLRQVSRVSSTNVSIPLACASIAGPPGSSLASNYHPL